MGTRRTSKVGACAVRISRLVAGVPDYGNADGAIVLCGGVSTFEYSWEVQDGEEILEFDACGDPCLNVKRPNFVKYVSGTLTLCKDDDRVHEIMAQGASLLSSAGEPVGYGVTPAAGCQSVSPKQVVVELWRPNYNCDDLDEDEPYKRLVLPRGRFNPANESIGNESSTPAFDFEGFGAAAQFQDGPFGDVLVTGGVAGMALFQIADDDIPDCPDPFDYVAIPAQS